MIINENVNKRRWRKLKKKARAKSWEDDNNNNTDGVDDETSGRRRRRRRWVALAGRFTYAHAAGKRALRVCCLFAPPPPPAAVTRHLWCQLYGYRGRRIRTSPTPSLSTPMPKSTHWHWRFALPFSSTPRSRSRQRPFMTAILLPSLGVRARSGDIGQTIQCYRRRRSATGDRGDLLSMISITVVVKQLG